jgi:hypothetical protein
MRKASHLPLIEVSNLSNTMKVPSVLSTENKLAGEQQDPLALPHSKLDAPKPRHFAKVITSAHPKDCIVAQDLQQSPMHVMPLPGKPLFLATLHVPDDLNSKSPVSTDSKDLIVCTKDVLLQVCGQTFRILTEFALASCEFVDCAISPLIHYVNNNHQTLKQ